VTGDLDIVPGPDPANLERLATALSSDVTAKKASDSTDYLPHPDVRPEEFFAEYFAMYQTAYGPLDVLIELPGVGSYDAIMRNARRYDLASYGVSIHVASLEDIIKSKETAGRSKDLILLPTLYEAADQLAREPDDYALDPDALLVDQPPAGTDT
jgi:hypothetical protein